MFFFNFVPPCGCGSHVTFWGVFGIQPMTGGHLFSNKGFIWTILHFCKLWCFSSTLCLHVSALGTAMYHVTLWGELAVCSDERSPNLWEVFIQTLIILREETIGQTCFEKNAMFFFNFVFAWGCCGNYSMWRPESLEYGLTGCPLISKECSNWVHVVFVLC